MNRLFVPTMGPSDWRRLLADPRKQWRAKKSAYEAAVSWESARNSVRGLPSEIAAYLDSDAAFRGAHLLLALPEHQVALEGGGHASQTDLWALLSAPIGVVSTAIEAKAGEPFDRTVREWLSDASKKSGKPDRLKQLCKLLRLTEADVLDCRYQLMHRPAAAILEARRFRLNAALFLVHAFGDNPDALEDYSMWRRLLKVDTSTNELQRAGEFDGVSLWVGWIDSPTANCATLGAAV